MTLELLTNSYVTLEEADAYLEARSSKWVASSEEQRERALVQATALIDDLHWLGQAIDVEQPLSWPRQRFSYFDTAFNKVVEVEAGSLPRRLKVATFNEAMHLITYPEVFEATIQQDFESITVGPISIEDKDTNTNRSIPLIPYNNVRKLLKPLLSHAYSGRTWWRAN
jgi:hypothetical protein